MQQIPFLFLALFVIVVIASPILFSGETDIDLNIAGDRIVRLFDDLLQTNPSRARTVLDFGITSCLSSFEHRRAVRRYRADRIDHLRDCRTASERLGRGEHIDPFTLESLLVDHLTLLMSIESETVILQSLMYAVYLHDKDLFAHFPADDELPRLLVEHAHERHYTMWIDILNWVKDNDTEETIE